jgi:hypothetical protein
MLKIVTLLNLTGLFLFRALFLTDVMITHDAPATMQAGTEVKVTVTIDKGALTGFAKLQIDMPEGLSAMAIDAKGASFTFAEGKAKFIWMALPNQPQFKVSYTLSAAATATGSLPITGKFSYIEDNERKTEEMPGASITITGTAMVQDNTPASPQTAANANDVTFAGGAAPVNEEPAIVRSMQGVAPQQGAGGVSAARTITPVSAEEMLVEVVVNKGDIRGFGKLQETIPQGFTALEKTSSEAIFTVQDRVVKFVWLNLPQAKEIKVVYKLRGTGQPEGAYTLNGEFGYLLNDQTQKAMVGSSSFFIGPKALEEMARLKAAETIAQTPNAAAAAPPAAPAPKPAPVTTAPPPAPAAQANAPVVAQAPPARTQEPPQAAVKPKLSGQVPAPESGITYKVQISAAHREVGGAYFAQRHRYLGDLSLERHEGWIKYVTGRHAEYRGARDHREELVTAGHQFPGPFVTAYNNGQRITVQEALMISNQRWVQ